MDNSPVEAFLPMMRANQDNVKEPHEIVAAMRFASGLCQIFSP
jgi:hypothetical protein